MKPTILGLALSILVACGDSAGSGVTDAGTDAATDGGTDVNAPFDAGPDAIDGNVAASRCSGATYTTAPSGAACDVKRVERSGDLAPTCYGPAVGALCDKLLVNVPALDVPSLPNGFVCGSPELGIATCVWTFDDDASTHTLDDAALEAACEVTAALPNADVVCTTYGD